METTFDLGRLRADGRRYLEKNHIVETMQSIIAAMLMEKPEDPITYMQEKIRAIQDAGGPANVNWESFVYHLHPSREPLHLMLVGGNDGNSLVAVNPKPTDAAAVNRPDGLVVVGKKQSLSSVSPDKQTSGSELFRLTALEDKLSDD